MCQHVNKAIHKDYNVFKRNPHAFDAELSNDPSLDSPPRKNHK